MENKCMAVLLVLLLFPPFFIGKTKAYDFHSYIPFLYKVPEGSAGVFKNGNEYYEDVYPAGVYPTWPRDEGFVISITPEMVAVTDISCITAEGVKIAFPRVIIHYQVHEEAVLGVVKGYGVDFVKPLIVNPAQQGIAHYCGTMTAEAVYFEEFSLLKQYLGDYLTKVQRDKNSGVSIFRLEIYPPRVPDEILDNHAGQNPGNPPQDPVACEQPYDIFYTLETEQETINRLCGSASEPANTHQDAVPEPASHHEWISGLNNEPEDVVIENTVLPDHKVPENDGPDPHATDPLIDEPESGDAAEPAETSPGFASEATGEESVNTRPVYPLDAGGGTNRSQPAGQVDEVTGQEGRKEKLYQQMQDSKVLWKNNNSRLYLSW